MRLVGLLIVLLPPAARTATAPAATTAMGTTSPLLSLNVPNPLNALGLGLGNLGGMVNAGMPFGNMFGFGSMLGHFHNYNLFFSQLLISGLFGLVILKILGAVVLLTALIAGGFLVKLVGLALVLAFVKSSHHHDHYSHHPYRRAFYTTIVQDRSPWLTKPPDNALQWDD